MLADPSRFYEEPPIDTVIDPAHVKERIVEYLGAVLARCFYDKSLLSDLERDPHRTLRNIGILLPEELSISVERRNMERTRLVVYEYAENRIFKRRICYLQMIMLAGK
jgi:hypothetical protein